MNTLIDFDGAVVVSLPVREGFGEPGPRECMLLEGPQGWGEFSPPHDAADRQLHRWLTAATEPGTVGWPDAVRGRVPVAVTVPAVDPIQAHHLASVSGCRTAEISVGGDPADDVARVAAVRDALGPDGSIRCVADGSWTVDMAVTIIPALIRAAGGLEYVERPCATLPETGAVRRRIDARVAVDVARVDAEAWASLNEYADVAVLTCSALGGVRRSLRVAEASRLPGVVRAGRQTSVGLAGAAALAGALPQLPFACAVSLPPWVICDVAGAARTVVAQAGYVPVAPMPPAPHPALLNEYAVTDTRTLGWWRRRLELARSAVS